LGKTDLFRTHEVPRVKAVLDTMNLYWKSILGNPDLFGNYEVICLDSSNLSKFAKSKLISVFKIWLTLGRMSLLCLLVSRIFSRSTFTLVNFLRKFIRTIFIAL
jgi:hypothetical protein